MENKTTPQLWIDQREEELKPLEEKARTLEPKIKQVWVEIANCEDEIKFIEKLQHEKIGERFDEGGKKWLVEMKKELEDKKTDLEKTKKELEAKVIRTDYLRIYVDLANRFGS